MVVLEYIIFPLFHSVMLHVTEIKHTLACSDFPSFAGARREHGVCVVLADFTLGNEKEFLGQRFIRN